MSPIAGANSPFLATPSATGAKPETPQCAPPPASAFGADNIARAGAEIAGGWLGASAGGSIGEQAGALLGAAVGTLCAPGPGTIAGEALGGMVGGLAGTIGGGIAGATLGKSLADDALGVG